MADALGSVVIFTVIPAIHRHSRYSLSFPRKRESKGHWQQMRIYQLPDSGFPLSRE